MSTASEILVIILSAFLTLFLVLGIVLTIYLIRITRQIKNITTTAEKAVSGIESTVSRISSVTSPLMFTGILNKYLKKIKKARK